jgi:hypothetical protein
MGGGRPRLHHARRSGDSRPADQGPPRPHGGRSRLDVHQSDDPRLRAGAAGGRAHERRAGRRPLRVGGQRRADGRPRGDLRADAGPLRRRGRSRRWPRRWVAVTGDSPTSTSN